MTGKTKRVAVALELNYGHKRHVETYAGCLKYAKEAGWDTFITPTSDRIFQDTKGYQRGWMVRVGPLS